MGLEHILKPKHPQSRPRLTWLEVCQGKFWRYELSELLAQEEASGALERCLLLVSSVVVEDHLLVCCDSPHIYSAHRNLRQPAFTVRALS